MIKQIPNFLTCIRIFIIPIVIFLMLLGDNPLINRISSAIFLIACITDFLDGYLARKFKSDTKIGKFLDPIADKLLVGSVILILVKQGKADLIPSIAIICREILVSGLREFLAGLKVSLPVSSIAKIKTFLQMTALFILILGNGGLGWQYTDSVGSFMLWISAALTIFTGYIYLRMGLKHISAEG